ncbi:MAG TPA: cytochrome P460 family protein [Pseudolabrys sp.]
MKQIYLALTAAATASLVLAAAQGAEGGADSKDASPIYGVPIPTGYRQWVLIAPAQEAAPLDELRAVLGNPTAIKAYREGTLPFPDGTVLAKLAWKHAQSPEFEPASIPGAATTVQIMVKDSKKYAATGGWGFGRFIGGKPVDEAQHQTCFACHEARVKGHDFVFTRFAP